MYRQGVRPGRGRPRCCNGVRRENSYLVRLFSLDNVICISVDHGRLI
jgi:hypothetical protein